MIVRVVGTDCSSSLFILLFFPLHNSGGQTVIRNLYTHTNINYLQSQELPITVEHHFTDTNSVAQMRSFTHTVNGSFWDDIPEDWIATHAIADGTEIPLGQRLEVKLSKTGRSVFATYVMSEVPPYHQDRRAYWLIIDDM
jgi:hypothetical protein